MSARNVSGVSTLGIELCMADWVSDDQLPGSVTAMARINGIGGINLEASNIDSSALRDYITQYISGRQDPGSSWTITINVSDDTIDQWKALQGQRKWFEIWHPEMDNSIFVVASIPKAIGFSDVGQNDLWTSELQLTLNSYHGWDTAVAPSELSPGTGGGDTDLTSIYLNKSAVTIASGDSTTLTATVNPAGSTVVWTSSDTSVATVSSGTVSAVGTGSCIIYASTGNKTATCVVTVSAGA